MKKLVIGIVFASVLMFATSAGASPNKWHQWHHNTSPVVTAMDKTYKQIGVDLVSNAAVQAESLFQTYSIEATTFATFAVSPSKVINSDVKRVSLLSNEWAWSGFTTLLYNTETESFTFINGELITALKKFTRDLTRYG